MRVLGFRIGDEKTARSLAKPADDSWILGAAHQLVDAVKWIASSNWGVGYRCFRPLVNQREGKPQFGGNLLGTGRLKDLSQHFMGLHLPRRILTQGTKEKLLMARRFQLPPAPAAF